MKYLVANWKMKLTVGESVALAREVRELITRHPTPDLQVVVCPSFPAIPAVHEAVMGSAIAVGAQDAASCDRGSLTGAVSLLQLRGVGVDTVIIGHSERRTLFHEGDEDVQTKVAHSLSSGTRTILCVGEDARQREEGMARAVVRKQVRTAVRGSVPIEHLLIAYEPVWTIGAGTSVDIAIAHEQAENIRSALGGAGYERARAARVPILYGGSVDADTVVSSTASPLSGTLVGMAGQTPASFIGLYEALRRASESPA